MAIHLDVFADLHERSVRQAADKLHDDLEKAGKSAGIGAGRSFGRAFGDGVSASSSKVEKAVGKAADALSKLNIEQERANKLAKSGTQDREKLIVQSEKLARATRQYESAVRSAAREQANFHKSGRDMTSTVATLNHSLSLLGKSGSSLAFAAAAPTLVAAAGAAVTASGALGLLPAATGAAGAAFGTLKLATLGFGDAMDNIRDPEKFAKSLQSLSPNAQQAALSIRELLPQFDKLKNATQDSLFEGVAGQLQQLSHTLMPTIQRLTTGIAASFNKMFMGVTNQLMTPETQAALENFTTNLTAAFQNLAPAAAPLTKAFADMMSVGSDFLPQLATAASNAATAFSKFVTEAQNSGQFKQWIADGLDMLRQVGEIAWDIGRAFVALAPVAQDVLPYIKSAVEGIANALEEHPGLIYAVVGAFAAWKTIEGVIALTGSLKAIGTLLGVTLPASAATGAAGIAAALAKVAVPAWLMYLVGQQNPTIQPNMLGPDGKVSPDIRDPNFRFPDTAGGGRPTSPGPGALEVGPAGPPSSNLPNVGGIPVPGAVAAAAPPVDIFNGYRPNPSRRDTPMNLGPTTGAPGWTPMAVPLPSGDSGSGGGPKLPVVPYEGNPADLIQGFPQTASLMSAASSVLDAQHKLAQDRSDLQALEKSNDATEAQIQDAKNDIIKSEQDVQQAEMRLNEAKQSATDKYAKTLKGATSQLGDIGAQLDSDFGISKGLAGIAENITKFIANLAAAPLLGQLDAISRVNPTQGGHGLMGILGAQGAFGPQYQNNQYADQQTQQGYGYAAAQMGPAALQPGFGMGSPGAAQPGESARAFAHRVMMPFWQQAGFEVGDHAADKYGEHQNGALDIMVDNLAEGQQVLQQVLSDPNTYGAIFNNQVYGYGQGASPRPYSGGFTGNPTQDHKDHVHAFYKPGGTNNITPSGPMSVSSPWGPTLGYGTPTVPSGYGPPPGPTYSGPSAVPGDLSGVPSMGGGMGPGGMPTAAPFATRQYGGVAPASGTGKGGVGMTEGGLLDTAIGVGASGLDMLAPGAGQAAQTGIKLANRAIEYGGQVAGIGAQGLMETFLPFGASELANNNWFTRIIGGIAGAAPALPNLAGKGTQAPTQEQVAGVDPNTTQHGQGQGQPPGPTYGDINVTTKRDDGAGVGRDIAYSLQAQHQAPGM